MLASEWSRWLQLQLALVHLSLHVGLAFFSVHTLKPKCPHTKLQSLTVPSELRGGAWLLEQMEG